MFFNILYFSLDPQQFHDIRAINLFIKLLLFILTDFTIIDSFRWWLENQFQISRAKSFEAPSLNQNAKTISSLYYCFLDKEVFDSSN